MITPKDIYNFYFLFSINSYNPEYVKTDYGKFIEKEYLNYFKEKYVLLFKKILYDQIKKYVSRGRIDPDFSKEKLSNPSLDSSELLNLMSKTFRSDLIRRNDAWMLVGKFLQNLENSINSKDIYIYIDRLNNLTHHTGGKVLGKVSYDLVKAYDKVHNAKSIKELVPLVDKDLRRLASQDLYEHMIKLKKLLPENIKLDPDMLANLNKPAGTPGSEATHQQKSFKDKEATKHKKSDKKDDKKSPSELELGPLDEAGDFDFFGTANKRIDVNTPVGKSTSGEPVFGRKWNKDKDKNKSKPDDKKTPRELDLGPLQEALQISLKDRGNLEFMTGLKQAVQDKAKEIKRELEGYPEDFIRGYKTVKRPGAWDKLNQRLTQWASDLGQSYGRR